METFVKKMIDMVKMKKYLMCLRKLCIKVVSVIARRIIHLNPEMLTHFRVFTALCSGNLLRQSFNPLTCSHWIHKETSSHLVG